MTKNIYTYIYIYANTSCPLPDLFFFFSQKNLLIFEATSETFSPLFNFNVSSDELMDIVFALIVSQKKRGTYI